MIKSMTAYGRGEVETATAEVGGGTARSVNHRFLELSLNLPRRLWALEDRFRKLIKGRLSRGRVDMQLSWETLAEKSLTLKLDKAMVAEVRGVLERLRQIGSTPESLRLEHFLHFSDLIVAKEQANQDLEMEETWEVVSQAVNQALDLLEEMRVDRGRGPGGRPGRPTWRISAGKWATLRPGAAVAPTLAGAGRRLAWRNSFPRAAGG